MKSKIMNEEFKKWFAENKAVKPSKIAEGNWKYVNENIDDNPGSLRKFTVGKIFIWDDAILLLFLKFKFNSIFYLFITALILAIASAIYFTIDDNDTAYYIAWAVTIIIIIPSFITYMKKSGDIQITDDKKVGLAIENDESVFIKFKNIESINQNKYKSYKLIKLIFAKEFEKNACLYIFSATELDKIFDIIEPLIKQDE